MVINLVTMELYHAASDPWQIKKSGASNVYLSTNSLWKIKQYTEYHVIITMKKKFDGILKN